MDRDWKKHKYYVKIKQGKSDRYFYTKEEYDAFKNSKEKNNAPGGGIPSEVSNQMNKRYIKPASFTGDNKKSTGKKEEATSVGMLVSDLVGRAMDKADMLPLKETASNTTDSSWKEKGYKSYRDYKKAIMDGKEDIPKKKDSTSVEEDLDSINPSYNGRDYQSATNCAYCSLAFDMRRRGYDVVADDETSVDNEDTIKDWYEEKREFTEVKGNWKFRDLKQQLSEYPDNSYGQFCVYWKNGGGHSMIWYKENGEIYIYDAQSYNYNSKVHDELNSRTKVDIDTMDVDKVRADQRKKTQTLDAWEHLYSNSVSQTMYLRTDDLTLSKKALKKVDYN